MGSTQKKKHQHTKQPNHLSKTLNDVVIGNNANANAIGNETSEAPTNDLSNIFGKILVGKNGACSRSSHSEEFWRQNQKGGG